MADVKLQDLPATTTLATGDLIPVSVDPAGSAASKNITRENFAIDLHSLLPLLPIATAAGSVDAITANYTPDISLADKKIVAFVASGANTSTTPTFSPDGLTARTIVKFGGTALVAGDIPAALAVCVVQYNLANTRWELLNPVYPPVGSSPTFVTVKLSGLTDLKVPKHVADATGLADTTITVSANNEVTNASQPAFLTRPASEQSDFAVSSVVTVVFGTEIFDQNADFASNTFTAPVTGKYLLSCSLWLQNLDTAAARYRLDLITSNRTYYDTLDTTRLSADPAYWSLSVTVVADMDAGDTAYCGIFQDAGTQQTDIATNSYFSGCLLC